MTPQEIAKKAVSKMNKKITNEIFLIIQNDRDLMKEYLLAVENEDNTLQTVNQTIGMEVKKAYELVGNSIEENPSCTLIETHTTFL